MLVLLDGKTFESSLIERAGSGRVMVRVPALSMGHGEQAHEFAQFPVLARPEHEMPVVGHQTVTDDSDGQLLVGSLDDLLHRYVIRVVVEQTAASDGSVQNVIGDTARRYPQTPWHNRQD
jgi:hypothetical protein